MKLLNMDDFQWFQKFASNCMDFLSSRCPGTWKFMTFAQGCSLMAVGTRDLFQSLVFCH